MLSLTLGLLVFVGFQSSVRGVCPSLSNDTAVVLLDNYGSDTLFPAWTALGEGWNISNTENCAQTVATCANVSQTQLITPFINSPATQVSVFVEFTAMDCTSLPSPVPCSTDFSLHIYATQSENVQSMDLSNYEQVKAVTPNATRIPLPLVESGFYLAFVANASSACVEITRVTVLTRQCPETVFSLVRYERALDGGQVSGTCVDGSSEVSAAPDVMCTFEGFDFSSAGACECMAGYEEANETTCSQCQQNFFKAARGGGSCLPCPPNAGNSGTGNDVCMCGDAYRDSGDNMCSECADNNYRSGSTCQSCPAESTSPGGPVADCSCVPGMATPTEELITTDMECGSCRTNYFRNMGDCSPCAEGSSRSFGMEEEECFCDDNRVTQENTNTTMGLMCTGCAVGFFNNGTGTMLPVCTMCPNNSMSNIFSDTSCQCNEGTSLRNGESETTSEPCSGCAANFFRLNRVCTVCPQNTFRSFSTDNEMMCSCTNKNYRRYIPAMVEAGCVPVVGFRSNHLFLYEGNSISTNMCLSANFPSEINIPVVLEGAPETASIVGGTNFNVLANTSCRMLEVQVMTPDNQIALEENITFSILVQSPTPSFVVGGDTEVDFLYMRITITIEDNDEVVVGFTESSLTFNESSMSPALTIMRLQPIASNLQLRISGVKSPLDAFPGVNLTPDEMSRTVPIMIDDDRESGQEERVVTLELMYDGPSSFVTIGGNGLYAQLEVTIVDDDLPSSSSFPVEAIIGVSAGGAGLAVLLLMIVILCVCICRLQVNRQGFYPTYEDKTSEPPTMLRYSASLRSISSQTVIPITEGRSAPKENEFYV